MEKIAFMIENGVICRKGRNVFDGLYLSVYEKEVLGLICDSTAEKKCLLQFFKGELQLKEGRAFHAGKGAGSQGETGKFFRDNLAVIEKTGKLIPTLSVLDNICLFADRRKFLFTDRYHRDMHRLMEEFSLSIDMGDDVYGLTARDRVIMELLKAYVEEKRIVVLADLTGFLRKNELEEVKKLIERMKEKGMSFLILEPFEDIVFEWSSRIAVMQHGKTVEVLDSRHVNRQKLYEALMQNKNVGENGDEAFGLKREDGGADNEVLKFENVETDYLKNVSFSLESGMLLKIFLLDDRSGEEILELLSGARKLKAGKILLDGKSYRVRSYTKAMKRGICFLGESPYDRTLVYDMTVKDNISLVLSRKSPFIWMRRSLSKSLERSINDYFHEEIANVRLRRLPPDTLQKVAHYKWILFRPRVVVCMKPFAEVDIHMQEITAQMITAYREQGIAVILLTANFSEVDRIEGETVYLKDGKQIDENQVYQILYGNE